MSLGSEVMIPRCNPDVLCVGKGLTTIPASHGIQSNRASWVPSANVLSRAVHLILKDSQGSSEARQGLTTQA